MRIQVPCKICGRPAVACWDDPDPNNTDEVLAVNKAVDQWGPMVAHNLCADRAQKRRESEGLIIRLCFRLHQQRAELTSEHITKIKQTLRVATCSYAEVLQEIHNAPSIIWSEEFVNILMYKPEACPTVLASYRDEVRRTAREAKLRSTTNDP